MGYNVQAAVDTEHHLIVAHDVTNVGTDGAQLAPMAKLTKEILKTDRFEVVADRGYFSGEEILACDEAGITVTLPKPQTSGNRVKGRFVKQDFRYEASEDVYVCPAGERLTYHYTNEEDGRGLRRYWTSACQTCAIKDRCTSGKEGASPDGSMSTLSRRSSVGSTRIRRRCVNGARRPSIPSARSRPGMGATHFLMKTLKRVTTEMALHVLAYNLTRAMNILGTGPLIDAMRASPLAPYVGPHAPRGATPMANDPLGPEIRLTGQRGPTQPHHLAGPRPMPLIARFHTARPWLCKNAADGKISSTTAGEADGAFC